MNKQEAVSQIMEIKAVLPEQLQSKLIDAVKVLANFKMISVDDSMPYDHPKLIMRVDNTLFFPLCVVRYEDRCHRLDNLYTDINGCWTWHKVYEKQHGKVTHWLATRILTEPHIMDESGNELKFE